MRVMVTHDGENWTRLCDNCVGQGVVYKGYVYLMWMWDTGHTIIRSQDMRNWETLDWAFIDDPSIIQGYGPAVIFKGEIYVVVFRETNQVDLWRLSVGGK